jgi:hypothetical protein
MHVQTLIDNYLRNFHQLIDTLSSEQNIYRGS